MPPIPITFARASAGASTRSGYDEKLCIIVPYRDRAEHLQQFIPHMLAYFQRDKLDRYIQYSIHIVEQYGTGPFNRGKLKNCGFALTKTDAGYVSFHDVDYLPIWADYSYCQQPARLIWHGLVTNERYESFFGGVLLFTPAMFERVNGYSNNYWGWGFEDRELSARLNIEGIEVEKRDGTFLALPHKLGGYESATTLSEEGLRNKRLFVERSENLQQLYRDDGLSSLTFEVVSSANLSATGETLAHVYHHVVKI